MNNKKITAIYHSADNDGFASAAIIKRKYPNAKMIGYNHNEPIPFDEIPKNEHIIMADISVSIENMEKLLLHSNFLFTWLDHHISAILKFVERYKIDSYENGKMLKGVFGGFSVSLQNNISACEITWKYLFPDEPIPRGIELLGAYDSWRNQDKDRWENEIIPFQFGIRSICNSVEKFPIDLFLNCNSRVDEIIEMGKVVIKYQTMVHEHLFKNSFECEFEGLRAICMNIAGVNSEAFKSVYNESKHDIMIPFSFNGKFWKFSIFTTKDIDCSLIAKKRGGGGHAKACGFEASQLSDVFKHIK